MDARQEAALAELTRLAGVYRDLPALVCESLMLVARTIGARMLRAEELSFLQAIANLLAPAMACDQTNQLTAQLVAEQMRELAPRLVTATQHQAILEERQRLARDLHDSVTQALYGITLHAEVVRRLLASGDTAAAAGNLKALQETAQEALDEMRLLIFELRPPILEQAGLAAALQARLDTVEGRANLQTTLRVDGVIRLPADVEQALYRIAQEALNNALKHARARQINVQLLQTSMDIVLEIADDGVGFDPSLASAQGGLGLHGIIERVAQMGGQLTLQSAPQAGAKLRVEVPL